MRPTEAEIPDKRYFRIGEVSALTGIEPYVLRYWETEFPEINPRRSRAGQRLYRRSDIEVITKVKDLLYARRYTIAGAKQYLKTGKEAPDPAESQPITLEELRQELLAIRDMLGD